MAAYREALSNAVYYEGMPVAEFCCSIETLHDRVFTGGQIISDGAMTATVLNTLPKSMEALTPSPF